MIEPNTEVKVKKIGRPGNPLVETAKWNEHNEGEVNTKSLPVLYTVKGKLLSDIEEGNFLTIERYERNGTEKYGVMRTSRIQEVREFPNRVEVDTQNSIYKIIDISDENEKAD